MRLRLLMICSLGLGLIVFAQPKCKLEKQKAFELLGSYIFDNHVETTIGNYKYTQVQNFTFSVFNTPSYRFYFDRSTCSDNVKIELFEIEKKSGASTLIFTSTNSEQTAHDVSNPKKKYQVKITVPAKTEEGCVHILLGFKMENDELVNSGGRKKPRIKFKD